MIKILEEEFLAAYKRFNGDYRKIAHEYRMDPNSVRQRIKRGISDGRLSAIPAHQPDTSAQPEPLSYAAELRTTREKLKYLQNQLITDEYVKQRIIGLTSAEQRPPPDWTTEARVAGTHLAGVPTLFCSDWHWGEVVRPSEIGGVNEYNLTIANARAETLITVAKDLLTQHFKKASYPGICLILGGDMLSGDIHDELKETNEEPTMVAWLDLMAVLKKAITELERTFGRVFIVCVTGNHGRNTHKPRAKRRNHSNFDWLLYRMLERTFEANKNVSFMIPDGPDCLYRLYHHRYMLTHGDQFRGGDGIIGALGPITRGDIKKRSKQAQINAGYDTLLMGHWHQLIQLDSLIVNGSLKGYDEYAASNNFKFESPRQALWVTHPEYGITFSMPVYVDRRSRDTSVAWASVAT